MAHLGVGGEWGQEGDGLWGPKCHGPSLGRDAYSSPAKLSGVLGQQFWGTWPDGWADTLLHLHQAVLRSRDQGSEWHSGSREWLATVSSPGSHMLP